MISALPEFPLFFHSSTTTSLNPNCIHANVADPSLLPDISPLNLHLHNFFIGIYRPRGHLRGKFHCRLGADRIQHDTG